MEAPSRAPLRAWIWLLVLCGAFYACTAPGRITFPDDEIVYQTTEALAERGSLKISGIATRTGEPEGRPSGTFGWGEGVRGGRYGFFGHGLSLVALPAYSLAEATVGIVPDTWHRASRSDIRHFHHRAPDADWLRVVVSFTNVWVTALAALMFGLWIQQLGYLGRTAVVSAGIYALCTAAFPYTSTFLSEPLSALVLLVATYGIARWHAEGELPWLWVAGVAAGFSVHVHVLNIVMLPVLAGYALSPAFLAGELREKASQWGPAVAIAAAGVLVLVVGQALRFGNPFETGRMGHYGHFALPFEGMVGQLIAPGRSVFFYSPALLVAFAGWPALRRRAPQVFYFALAMFAVRWLFVSMRSDWYGGWAIGPRYLVPVIPFLLLPVAEVLESAWDQPLRRRVLMSVLALCALLELHLASHSIFQWMTHLSTSQGRGWAHVSHWDPAASPIVGFFTLEHDAWRDLWGGRFGQLRASLQIDALSFGAFRLAKVGHPGLLVVFIGVLASGVGAAVGLCAWLWNETRRPRT